ncbi:MAG TPA: HAD hydrolase family protein [Pyrinomonadaceae bacterium]|nr:HAD hydrolase family protein [Pyrinomonadaceae bacterium]
MNEEILQRARKIKLLLMDCDGVLTDGRLYFTESGETMKVFHVRDGQGIVSWHRAGFRSGIISGRNSPIVEIRAKELGIEFVRQGAADKIGVFEEILALANVSAEETAFVGDDIPDIALFERVGLAIAVADAVEEAKAAAHFTTENKGGRSAVREIADWLLQAKEN